MSEREAYSKRGGWYLSPECRISIEPYPYRVPSGCLIRRSQLICILTIGWVKLTAKTADRPPSPMDSMSVALRCSTMVSNGVFDPIAFFLGVPTASRYCRVVGRFSSGYADGTLFTNVRLRVRELVARMYVVPEKMTNLFFLQR
jgi:hypothetical protein